MKKNRQKQVEFWVLLFRTWRDIWWENNNRPRRAQRAVYRPTVLLTPRHCLQSSVLTVLILSVHSFMRNTLSGPPMKPFLIPPSPSFLFLSFPFCLSNPSRPFVYFLKTEFNSALVGVPVLCQQNISSEITSPHLQQLSLVVVTPTSPSLLLTLGFILSLPSLLRVLCSGFIHLTSFGY